MMVSMNCAVDGMRCNVVVGLAGDDASTDWIDYEMRGLELQLESWKGRKALGLNCDGW